jgi:hypothetical protein
MAVCKQRRKGDVIITWQSLISAQGTGQNTWLCLNVADIKKTLAYNVETQG